MSQTIEELIMAKEQELGLNQTELEALKDYAKQVSVLVKANEIILEDPKVQEAASKNKMNTALKTTDGIAKGVGIAADVSIYMQQGDSLALAITKAIVDVATAETIDKILLRGFGKSANLVEYALNLGDVTVGLKSPGTLAAEDAVKWTDWSWNYYIGPNVTIDRTKADTLIIDSKNGTTSQILHHNWDGGWESWFNSDKFLKDVSNWTIISGKNGDNETIELKNNTLLEFTGYTGGKDYHITYPFQSNVVNPSYDHLTEVLGYLAQKGIEHIDVSLNGGSARAVTSFVGHISGMEDGSWLASNASNEKVFYALQTLKGYVFDTNVAHGSFNQVESKLFSDKYIQDRAKLTALMVNANLSAEGKENVADYFNGKNIVYQDLSQNIYIGNNTNGHYTKVVFTGNSTQEYRELGWITYNIYGGDGNNILHSAHMNDYIEGGEGSDTIYSYNGDDIIYTNANLKDNDYDLEDAGTTNTVYAGDGEDRIYGSNGIDIIYADSDSSANPNQYDNNDLVEGRGGSDKIYGGDGRDTLYADSASSHADTSGDYIVGGLGADTIHGSDGNDTLYGDNETDGASWVFSDKDTIHGYGGSDTIYGGADDDTLIGGLEGGVDDGASDYLEGGEGKDTYLVNNGDTIMDSDGKGLVKFDNIDLTGKKYKNSKTGRYEDDDYIYDGDPDGKGPLTVTSLKDSSKSITIQAWENKALGIELLDNKDIEVSIDKESTSTSEKNSGKQPYTFLVTLSRPLGDGESLEVSVPDTDEGSYTFTNGEQSHDFTHSWYGDTYDEGIIDHVVTFTPTASYDGPYKDVKVTIKNSFTLTVNDDDEDKRHDPLALDTNKDGFISTSDLETSGTYFDITGDGLRERVGWIKSEDALVTYDKNDNGQIDGISEVFGNMNESGFEELKRLIDSNHDNIIDRKDELFNRLQVWNDFNQDAKVQEGELRSLKDAGVTSIDLNYVSTNIEINGNLLTEASKYTDAQGNKELAADIQLATDAKDTKLDLEDLPQDFTIDLVTQLLPQLKGTGLVYDSLITYNLDPEFKALAQEMSTNIPRVATEFSTFLEHYSGYTAYVNELQEKYSIENFEMQEADKQAWIVERFEATDKYTTTINNHYNSNLNKGRTPTTPITESDTVAIKYQSLTDTLQSTFAMQSV